MPRRRPSKWQAPLRLERRYGIRVPREPERAIAPSLRAGLTLDELITVFGTFLDALSEKTGVRPVTTVERALFGRLVSLLLGERQDVFSAVGVYVLTLSTAPNTVLYVGRSTNMASAIRGRLLDHFLPSGGREGVAAQLREALNRLGARREFESDWRAQHRCLRQAVLGSNRWHARGNEPQAPEYRPSLRAAADLVRDGAFELAVLPLRGDGCEYAVVLEWLALEASLRLYGQLPPLNTNHAALRVNGYRQDRARWQLPDWKDYLDHCAAVAVGTLRTEAAHRRL